MRLAALISLTLSACTNVHVNRAALVASTAALACDWGHTRHYAEGGWATTHDVNPVLGRTPSVRAVDGYFLGIALTNVLIWSLVPERWRLVVPAGVLAVQANAAAINLRNDTETMCGL